MSSEDQVEAELRERIAVNEALYYCSPSDIAEHSRQQQRKEQTKAYRYLKELLMKVMQWAHTFLSCKLLYYLFVLDGAVQGTVSVLFIFLYKLVLDQLTETDNAGVATFASCCWIVREGQELGSVLLTVAQAFNITFIGPWTANGICFSVVTWLSLHWGRVSLLSFFTGIVLWELLALPIGAQLAVMDEEFDFHIKARPFHRIWILAFILSILLRDIDPYELRKRAAGKAFGDKRLRIPWDPIFY